MGVSFGLGVYPKWGHEHLGAEWHSLLTPIVNVLQMRTKLVITLRRAGSGTRCNWIMWKILNAFGITDVSIKVHGSRNNLAQTHAIFNALQRMATATDIAERRGKRVLDMTPRTPAGWAGHRAD